MTLEMTNNKLFKLAPILMGLFVGALSSFVKFKGYTARLENILNGTNELNLIITKIRDSDSLSKEIMSEYNRGLEIIEKCVTPTERAEFLKLSTKNLVSVTKAQLKYIKALHDLNTGTIELSESEDTPPTPNPDALKILAFDAEV
tara:strand:- start:382 stop:816 length:435 start_codon:yes stop_codon:yes gene_type:complete